MLTPKENFLETIKKDGKPDRLVNQYEAVVPIMNDPMMQYVRCGRAKGLTTVDRWGTLFLWPEDQYAATPHVTEEFKVIPDIKHWRDYVRVPDLKKFCSFGWEKALASAEAVNRDEKLVMGFMGTGIFEQTHFLMGFEDTFINMMMEPECFEELLATIFEYRLQYAKLIIENLKPDIILSHDDWGAKTALFMRPDTWRHFFKPLYEKLYGYMKEQGVLVMHHADSYLADIVEDMIDLNIDIWQGVLPTNDIAKVHAQVNGRMALMGGIDSIIDRQDTTEAVIRAEVKKVCKEYASLGQFIPSMTYGLSGTINPHVEPIVKDEIDHWNRSHTM